MRHPHDKAESRFATDTGISKEDEERYKKLVLENEELQKLIAQVRMTNDIYIQHRLTLFLFRRKRTKSEYSNNDWLNATRRVTHNPARSFSCKRMAGE